MTTPLTLPPSMTWDWAGYHVLEFQPPVGTTSPFPFSAGNRVLGLDSPASAAATVQGWQAGVVPSYADIARGPASAGTAGGGTPAAEADWRSWLRDKLFPGLERGAYDVLGIVFGLVLVIVGIYLWQRKE